MSALHPTVFQKRLLLAPGRALLIVAALLALAISLSACGLVNGDRSSERGSRSRDSEESGGSGLSRGLSISDDRAGSLRSDALGGSNPQPASVLGLIPNDTQRIFRMDVQKLLTTHFSSGEFDLANIGATDVFGISAGELSEVIMAEWYGGDAIVLKGSFIIDDIRNELEDAGGVEGTYRGYEVWEGLYGDGAAALLDGYVLTSDSVAVVESLLKNLYTGSGSLERADEYNNMKYILDKLGSGFVIFAVVGSSCQVADCEGYGYAVNEIAGNDEEVGIEVALLFRNQRAAERAADDYDQVADFLEYQKDVDIRDTEADGRFVTGIAISDGPEAVAPPAALMPLPPTEAPARRDSRVIYPTDVLRAEWIDYCYDYSSVLSRDDCNCVYEYLEYEGFSPVPQWDIEWENGYGPGAEAVAQCY